MTTVRQSVPQLLKTLPDDPTVEEIRTFLPPFVADEAVFDGWTEQALVNAADMQGISPDVVKLAFSGDAIDMIDCWIRYVDAKMCAEYPDETLAAMKIREKITAMVWFRLMSVAQQKEALRRATSIMALPGNAVRTARISWRSADLMWRLAGDKATDYNHYTKRAILSGVYGSTLMVFLDDVSEDHSETRAFLERRIENVMQFEKAKAKLLNNKGERFDLTRFLGRLRYPAK